MGAVDPSGTPLPRLLHSIWFGELLRTLETGMEESGVESANLHLMIVKLAETEMAGLNAGERYSEASSMIAARLGMIHPDLEGPRLDLISLQHEMEFNEKMLLAVAGDVLPKPPQHRDTTMYYWWYLICRLAYTHRCVCSVCAGQKLWG